MMDARTQQVRQTMHSCCSTLSIDRVANDTLPAGADFYTSLTMLKGATIAKLDHQELNFFSPIVLVGQVNCYAACWCTVPI